MDDPNDPLDDILRKNNNTRTGNSSGTIRHGQRSCFGVILYSVDLEKGTQEFFRMGTLVATRMFCDADSFTGKKQ